MTQEEAVNSTSDRFSYVVELVASRTGIARSRLLNRQRGRDEIAHARQLAMYILHVLLEVSMTRTGQLFGRDRTTVAHACARVEDRRDDGDFDRFLEDLEAEVKASFVFGERSTHNSDAHPQRVAA